MARARVEVRPAEERDDAALCELFRRVTMDGDLRLAVGRDPSFFGLYRLQELSGQRVVVAEVEGRLEGVATVLARPAWFQGEQIQVGYMGDLRLSPALRGGFFFGRRFGSGLSEIFAELGIEVALTAIIRSNEVAVRFLTRRSRRFPDQPIYRPWRRFQILSVHFTRQRRPRRTRLRVRAAEPGDLPALAELLAADQRRRPFGYVLDEAILRARLERWPGLRLEDFLLAEEPAGRLVGAAAFWDAHAVKRFVVEEYRGSMRWVRSAFNLGAFLFRFPPLPPVGEVLPYGYWTHFAHAADADPGEVGQALFDALYQRRRGGEHRFTSVCLLEDDPLAPVFARYTTTPLPAQLFTVSLPGSRFAELDPGPGRPGFEMALV